MEKDLERYKLEATQMSEKHEELFQENQTLKSRNSAFKDDNTKLQTDLNEIKVGLFIEDDFYLIIIIHRSRSNTNN